MDNIAEEFERNSRLEFINSIRFPKGECGELKSQLLVLLMTKGLKFKNRVNHE